MHRQGSRERAPERSEGVGALGRGTVAPPAPLQVAFQGTLGAFSEEACRTLAPQLAPLAFDTFGDVFEALAAGRCAYAVLPLENSVAGPVPEVAAWLPSSGTHVVARCEQPIHLMLLGVAGAVFEDVRSVESHPMALKQCRQFVTTHRLEPREVYDTAGAAKMVAAAGDPSRAAVASRLAAERYGLTVLRAGVEDGEANRTLFLLLRAA